MSQSKVIIGFGGNKGPTLDIFRAARPMLEKCIGRCLKTSKVYRSKPMVPDGVDPASIQEFLNCAALFETSLSPHEILESCLKIEEQFGRNRQLENRWQTRTLDLDILAMGTISISEPTLSIPHSGLDKRDFVLYPIYDLDSDYIHPKTNQPIKAMIESLEHIYIEAIVENSF